jgi:6-pyruvoyltetrahydropterin/6-carboxytetrahydropterin synthase
MFRISVYDYFSSAHQLKGYEGKCEEIHGHNWKVEIEVEGNELDKVGMLIDFKELKNILKGVIDELDHKMLNDLEAFKEINPSSEIIARYIHGRVKGELPLGVDILSTSVWESENSKARYSE